MATVEMIHVRKTGALILASARIGALVAGATGEDLIRISHYGEYLGLAFQIADDILDAQGGIAVGERTESSHKERKKATYPSVVGIVTAKDRLTELLRMSLSALDSYETQAEPLRALARYIVGRAVHIDGESLK